MKILIIGGGNMGLTYARSFIRSSIVTSEEMMILEKSPQKAVELSKLDLGKIYGQPEDCLEKADLIILAVKPQDVPALFKSIEGKVDKQQVFLSIMAGITIESLQKGLQIDKVIRAMPNLPAQIGMGMTAFTSTDAVTRIELVTVQNLLNTTGKTIYVEEEDLLDAATAISGSGPAYVFYCMQALMESAEKMGFSTSEAELLVWQTFKGAVELFHKNALSTQDWIARVSSKGGTTEAAVSVFEEQGLREALMNGADAARNRAMELGK
ncbi:MAG: pyrroline-5-carboxylate reductase [Saprospiraceae bacterium]|nr:pyrroline-5-carboxylate reductase [Saprospiraceae bacterium]